MKKRAWTEEQRKAQAEILRERRPWEKSTGPKSAECKAKVAQNSVKHGLRGGFFRATANFLAEQNRILKEIIK